MLGSFFKVFVSAAVMCLAAVIGPARAQVIPERTITLIVPYAAGGTIDAVARVVSGEMSKRLNRTIIILNKPGAGALVGTTEAARSAPDGTTILFAANSALVNNIALFDKLPYDPINDFAPLVRLASVPMVLAASKKAPFNSLSEMVDYAKKNPEKVTRGSAGVTNINNIGLVYIEGVAGFKAWHIPYTGDSAAVPALLAGDIDIYATPVGLLREHIRAGNIKGLAVLGANAVRDPDLPDVPTTTEAGFPAFDVDAWYALVVPAKTPANIVAEFNKAANDALKSSSVVEAFKRIGVVPAGGTPENLQKLVEAERARWVPLIRKLNIKSAPQ